MSALPATGYLGYAYQRAAEAQRVVDTHTTCAYTGICRACGRPGPCPDQLAARRELAHAAASTATPAATATAVRLASSTAEELREACFATEAAADHVASQVDGVTHPLLGLARARWDAALRDLWQALTLVRAGLAESRQCDGADPADVAVGLDGLRASLGAAERAATSLHHLRRRLAAAEARLRHGDTSPCARTAVGRWRAAGTHLDLATARLAVGIQALDRYADRLGAGTGHRGDGGSDLGRAPSLDQMPEAWHPPVAEVAAGARTAAGILLTRSPSGRWPGVWARVRRRSPIGRARRAWDPGP